MNDKGMAPCPFCGSEDIDPNLNEPILTIGEFASSCRDCGAVGPIGCDKESAVELWNERVNNEAVAVLKQIQDWSFAKGIEIPDEIYVKMADLINELHPKAV